MIVLEIIIMGGMFLANLATGLVIDYFVVIRRQSRPK